ncbi:DUF2975 domain-containing protein [Actinoplanes sp. L3-i22]|uniref:DUF2975 domain-containing protein n=1 Tax=Actinoplanes sp. L3-i22 TaxID=2836373 RepID=UPI001C77B712|nr:DUF2975 domain-containing protein [Actinoplanes sp. L3-i22]BCY06985.1 hypothetical protein L3i22_020730 [Actinoplanes sp. L3-i22]
MKTEPLTEFHRVLLIAALGSASVCVFGVADTLTRGAVVVSPGATSADVVVADPSGAQLALSAAAGLPTCLLATAMLVLLYRLVGAARRGDPLFSARTVGKLRTVGWILLVGGPAASALEFLARFALSGTVGPGGNYAEFDPARVAIWMVTGFGLLAVGEIVRRGQDLRAELDEVI